MSHLEMLMAPCTACVRGVRARCASEVSERAAVGVRKCCGRGCDTEHVGLEARGVGCSGCSGCSGWMLGGARVREVGERIGVIGGYETGYRRVFLGGESERGKDARAPDGRREREHT